MPAQSPDDIHRLFAAGLNAGNVDAVVDLFEEHAILVSDPNRIVRGRDAIREGLVNFLTIGPKLTLNASRVVRNGDIALLYSDWTIKGLHPDGQAFSTEIRPTHVVRRQADGTWRIVIDDPSANEPAEVTDQ
jgi:uncharacterized protein (TIGR02246 family)